MKQTDNDNPEVPVFPVIRRRPHHCDADKEEDAAQRKFFLGFISHFRLEIDTWCGELRTE